VFFQERFNTREKAENYVAELQKLADQNPKFAEKLSEFPIRISFTREKSFSAIMRNPPLG